MTHSKVLPTILSFLFVQLFAVNAAAFDAWWQCSSRQGGDWTFGRAPSICLVDHMQTQASVKNQYDPILFEDPAPRTSERRRYMTELNSVAKEMARYYIQRRKPNASEQEVQAFTKGLLTLMHQETVWTHFRQGSDSRVRYMRGDSGHGHGLMQVDDRSHQSALLDGKGVDLIYNMIYGLDIFFAAWERAPNTSCLNSPTNYTNRIRSAWAAYNGGPGRICRWTSSSGTFAHHDVQFLEKLNAQSFKSWVNSETHSTPLNIDCLVEGNRPCANTGSKPVIPADGKIYHIGSFYCRWGSELYCIDRLNDLNCLSLAEGKDLKIEGVIPEDDIGTRKIVMADRNQICVNNVKGLFEVTQQVELQKSINIRRTPGGDLLKTATAGAQTRVLDFEVTSASQQYRYYKINSNGTEGYVYAGDVNSYLDWVKPVADPTEPISLVANIGDSIEITGEFGINLRVTPGGSLITRVPNGEVLDVLDRVVQGSKNYLYYKISYSGRTGYIYSGYLDDMNTISSWTSVVQTQSFFALRSDVHFRFLRECPEAECGFSPHFLMPNTDLDQVSVLEVEGQWVKVINRNKTKQGWMLRADLMAE